MSIGSGAQRPGGGSIGHRAGAVGRWLGRRAVAGMATLGCSVWAALRRAGIPALVLALAPGLAAAQPSAAPAVSARHHLLVDLSSGQVLSERDADQTLDPGPLTQLMTTQLVFDALRDGKLARDSVVPVSARAVARRAGGGAVMYAEPDQPLRVEELLRGLVVIGAEDAAVALAEALGGDEAGFVATMNRRALAFGLANTLFRHADGRPGAGQFTSARDLATLGERLLREHPTLVPLHAQRQLLYAGIRQDNPNRLLGRDASVDGLRAAASETGGHGLVATAVRDTPAGPRRLLVVLLGAPDADTLATDAQQLLNWGWQAWDAVRLFAADQPVLSVPVWKGARDEARLGATGALVVTVPRGQGAGLSVQVERTDPLVAPLTAGQRVGRIVVTTASGATVAERPLVVQQAVPLAGLLGRAWDALRLWIR